ncbi:helix-turn-helix transcriptional regulator [Brevundimonas sp. GN22]
MPAPDPPDEVLDSLSNLESTALLSQDLAKNALAHWINEESKARILLSSDMEIHWMSEAAKALVTAGIVRVQSGRWQPRTKLTAEFVKNTKLDDYSCAIFRDIDQRPWVLWGRRLTPLPNSLIGLIFQPPRQFASFNALVDMHILTKTEGRVVELLLNGFETSQIAQELGISSQTLKTHIKHAYSKLGVSSRGELFAQSAAFARP